MLCEGSELSTTVLLKSYIKSNWIGKLIFWKKNQRLELYLNVTHKQKYRIIQAITNKFEEKEYSTWLRLFVEMVHIIGLVN